MRVDRHSISEESLASAPAAVPERPDRDTKLAENGGRRSGQGRDVEFAFDPGVQDRFSVMALPGKHMIRRRIGPPCAVRAADLRLVRPGVAGGGRAAARRVLCP